MVAALDVLPADATSVIGVMRSLTSWPTSSSERNTRPLSASPSPRRTSMASPSMQSVHSPAGQARVNGCDAELAGPGHGELGTLGRELRELVVEELGDVHLADWPPTVRVRRSSVGIDAPLASGRQSAARVGARPGGIGHSPPMMTPALHGRWAVSFGAAAGRWIRMS